MMELTDLQQQFKTICPLKYQEPMSQHTSLRIGGNVEIMAFPRNREELADVLRQSALLDCKIAILGAGTNVLAPDEGISGVVICLKDCLDGMERLEGNKVRIMAGVTMTRAAVYAANLGLSGLEFAHGIPGTVGGGVFMNAGAYGGEICQVIDCVEVMDFHGNIRTLPNDDLGFSYRHSVLEDTGDIVLSATFSLLPKPISEIKNAMKVLMAKRSASQPLDLPSAGSAFKRPKIGYAAALIDNSGLKGYQVGGAAISTKHAGFAVNLGGATARDFRILLKNVSDIVYEKSGVQLEPEIRIW